MMTHIPFGSLGRFTNDWLNARHHFSFGHYWDPKRMGFGPLRVWNDDTIKAGTGFDPHPHEHMEIITYVRKGAISHRDNLGNQGRTSHGEVQVMSAGSGIVHAEYNLEPGETQIFQIWIQPNSRDVKPQWQARQFPEATDAGKLVVMASGREGDEGALPIHQDAALLAATIKAGESVTHHLGAGRGAYLVPATGRLKIGNQILETRDGLAVQDETSITIEALEESELVLVDVPLKGWK